MTILYSTAGGVVPVYDTAGRLVWGETSPAVPEGVVVTPPSGPSLNVATMCSVANIGRPATAGGAFAGTRHIVTVDVDSPVLAWDIFPGFQGIDATGILRAAVTTPRETVEVTFGGSPERVIESPSTAGVLVTTDPVPVKIKAGETITVLSWIDTPGGQKVPADLTSVRPTDPGVGTGSWSTAPALTPRNGAGSLTGGIWSLRPSRIVAPTNRPSWVVVGDSIMQQSWTFGEMAVNALGQAGTKAAQGGNAYLYQAGKLSGFLDNATANATHMIDQFGINDSGRTWDVIAKDALKTWNQFRAKPHLKYIVKTTLTLGGAAKDRTDLSVAQAGNRELFNTWLRDGAPILNGAPVAPGTSGAARASYVRPDGTVATGTGTHPVTAISDVVHVIESVPNSGKYSDAVLPLVGGDALHPATGIHEVLADRLVRDLGILKL